ncbi:hypothetical protein, partial [Mycobacteroides abscessus]|uniref:hypothetical protein n=1 Tax=Mycobacteroides abscessus TaxID=36809 RepID=UPI000A82FBB5
CCRRGSQNRRSTATWTTFPEPASTKGLGELVTASEWKRAAIVWAFTSGAVKGHKSTSGLSVSDFLAHDINGLNSKTTVAKYRKAWKLAIERGFATDVKPGDLIDLPDVEWPRITIE